jgi:hypothetical protein
MPGATENSGRARCVVWRRRGTIVPDRLTDALSRSGCAAVHAESEFEAMVHLCRGGGNQVNVLLVVEPQAQAAVGEVIDIVERYVPDAVLWAYEGVPTPQIRAVSGVERVAWRGQPKGWLNGAANGAAPPAKAEKRGPALTSATKQIADEAAHTRQVKLSKPNLRLTGEGPAPREGATEVPSSKPPQAELKVAPASNNIPQNGAQGQETQPERPSHLLTDEELAMLLAIEPGKGHN